MTGRLRRLPFAGALILALCGFGPMPEDEARLRQAIAALQPQRPGVPDLYVLAVAGDGSEQVFRNEALHLLALARTRLGADGRALALANHPPQAGVPTLPLASIDNLKLALAGIGARMNPGEDLLLLYLSTHGTEEHRLYLNAPGHGEQLLAPDTLRQALDQAGIRHRVLVISACYSGGFIPALRGPDSLVLTAARRDRPSFGCGTDSVATYFGRAWLVDGLNHSLDFEAAFLAARRQIAAREREEGLLPSQPQMAHGARIGERLAAWRDSFTPGPALAYAWKEPEPKPVAHAAGQTRKTDQRVRREFRAKPPAGDRR
ncbi:C13 family peptidase [Arenimonas fontis]|uniref:Peptidase C13 n=1 Tax=Arenimonas fontis TaxID=2608255 RepID=A0A5B2ZBG6_9GAMM|nr:C13 family peptidase [Arenimonas fontis]KAA2284514.1 peptidase C13 [Arenimonas fontis]